MHIVHRRSIFVLFTPRVAASAAEEQGRAIEQFHQVKTRITVFQILEKCEPNSAYIRQAQALPRRRRRRTPSRQPGSLACSHSHTLGPHTTDDQLVTTRATTTSQCVSTGLRTRCHTHTFFHVRNTGMRCPKDIHNKQTELYTFSLCRPSSHKSRAGVSCGALAKRAPDVALVVQLGRPRLRITPYGYMPIFMSILWLISSVVVLLYAFSHASWAYSNVSCRWNVICGVATA